MKLLVVTIELFQEIELHGFIGTLKRSNKLEKIVYWNPDDKTKVSGSNGIGYIETVCGNVNVDDFDAIFVPGGAACISLRKNEKAIDLIKKFIDKDKWVFAICDAPNAIYDNNIFVDRNYSSYPIENIQNISGKNRDKEYVTIDGKYITGKCPSASIDLAIKVAEIVFNKDTSNNIYKEVYGIE